MLQLWVCVCVRAYVCGVCVCVWCVCVVCVCGVCVMCVCVWCVCVWCVCVCVSNDRPAFISTVAPPRDAKQQEQATLQYKLLWDVKMLLYARRCVRPSASA